MLCSRSASLTSSTRMSSRQREQELAQVFRGALILRLRLDLAELGHPVDQPRDIGAEQFLDLLVGGDGVLDRVVEDRGDDRLVVELQIGEDAGDFDRMAEIRVARGAHLGAVGLHREDIGAVEQGLVGIGIVGPNLLDQLILPQHAPMWGDAGSLRKCEKRPARPDGRSRPSRGRVRVAAGDQLAAGCADAEAAPRLGRRLHLASSAAPKARPLATKLSSWPARLARPWQSTAGRLSAVLPRQGRGRSSS